MLSTVFYNQQRSGYEELLSYGPLFIGICWKWTPTTDLQEKRLM